MFLKLIILFLMPFALANTSKTQIWSGFNEFSQGELIGAKLSHSGEISLGYATKTWASELPNAVTAAVFWKKGLAYIATSGPAQIWEVFQGAKPRLVLELQEPIITHMLAMPNGELAIVTAPNGGVTFVYPDLWRKSRKVKIPGSLYGISQSGNSLDVVGDNGSIFTITGAKVEKKPVISEESRLRSIHKSFYGSADTGTVYKDQEPIFKNTGEVIALLSDSQDNLYAAINTSKSSSQIWKISDKDLSCSVWESKTEIIHSMALEKNKLFWGTGPGGHVFSSNLDCENKSEIVLSLPDNHRIMSLVSKYNQLLVTTAQKGRVLSLDLSKTAKSGAFKSPVLKLDGPARVLKSSSPVWLGNTPERDNTWWNASAQPKKQGQYAQAQAEILPGKPVTQIEFSYEFQDHSI